jgi:exopolysaccharide production protein ExoZ
MLRAIAVILVIWCHAYQVLGTMGVSGIRTFGAFGIDIFFVISGFILSLSVLRESSQPGLQPMWEFLKRRFLRIYPIYWFVALITMARLANSHQLMKHSYLAAFFLVPTTHPKTADAIFSYSWTLNFEVFFYFLLGLILLRTVKRAVTYLILILLLLCGIGMIFGIVHPVVNLIANPILLEFVFGAAIALMYVRIGRKRAFGVCLTLVGIIASFYVRAQTLPSVANGAQMIMQNQGAFGRVGTWGVCAALLVGGLVFWSPSMDSTFGRWSVLLGNASYSSYLVSALGLEFAYRIFFKLYRPSPSVAYMLSYAISTVVTVTLMGVCCYVIVEKPMLRRLQKALLHKTPVIKATPTFNEGPIIDTDISRDMDSA